jgi:flagellar FliL protein
MKKKPIILAAAGVLALLLAGGGFFAFRAFSGGKSEEKVGEKAEGHGENEKHAEKKDAHGAAKEGHGPQPPAPSGMGPVFAMEPFTVNLADQGRPRYLKLVLQAELEATGSVDELEGVRPKVRDSILMLLSAKTASDVTSVEGKETLRNEIIRRLNSFCTKGKVAEVYFTDFVVQ